MTKIKYILLAAISIDGKIARHESQFTDWTGKEDKEHLRSILNKSDVIIVGNNTYKTAKKPLTKRNCIILTKSVSGVKLINNQCVYLNPQKINLKKYLTKYNYKNICILGGTQTYNFAFKNNLVDEIYLTIEPLIFGQGLSLIDIKLNKELKFKLISVKKLNKTGSLLLFYKK